MSLNLGTLEIANFAYGELAADFVDDDVTLSLKSAHAGRFPTGPFVATIWNSSRYPTNPAQAYWEGQAELIYVGGRTGTTLTGITRTAEGGDGLNSIPGDTYSIMCTISGGVMSTFIDEFIYKLAYLCTNVVNYGADATGAADSTSAIEAAIAAAPTGGTIFFPPGDYKYDTITVTRPLMFYFSAGTHTALSNPLYQVGTVKHVRFTGAGKDLAIFQAADETGYVFDVSAEVTVTNDSLRVEQFSISGNASASGGFRIQGERNGFHFDGIWIYDFTAENARGLTLNGCNQGLFVDCDCTGMTSGTGVYFEEYAPHGSTSNLHTFIRGSISGNKYAIYATGGGSMNRFDSVNIASNSNAPCVVIEWGLEWTFEGCYFESNGSGGYSLIQLGSDDNGTFRCNILRNHFGETGTFTCLVHVYNGPGNRVCYNSKACAATVSYMVSINSGVGINTAQTFCEHNYGNYPWDEVLGASGSDSDYVIGHETSHMYRSVDGSGGYIWKRPLILDCDSQIIPALRIIRDVDQTIDHIEVLDTDGVTKLFRVAQGGYVTASGLSIGATWNGDHLVMGAFHFWVSAAGKLYVKNGAPANDTDGTVVGAQS